MTCLKSRGPVAPPVGATQRAVSSVGAGGPRSHIRQGAYQCVSKGCCCSDAAWFALRWEGLLSRAGTLYQCWFSWRSTARQAKARQAGPRYRCSSATFLADVGGPGADCASEQAATSPGREPRSRSRIRAAASSRSSAVIAVVLRSASLAPPPPPPPSLPSALVPPPRASPARRSMRSSCH